jgi:two-component sensor histidine kinase
LYFSYQRGYIAFLPEQLRHNPKPPELVLTSFRLANGIVNPSGQGPLREPLLQAKEIQLQYNQNVFSFDFAAFDYSNPEGNRHYFMLENYDQEWRPSGVERRAYYINVPPGRYTFRVKAANSYGIWAEKSIEVIITPPWWRTGWFYALCILTVTALVYALFRYRLHQKLKAYELRNTISRDLHDEVGSTLSNIRFLSAMALDDIDTNKQKAQSTVSNINESANKMLDAMNDIIWNIQPQNDALDNMIPRMVSFASELLEAQRINLHCHIADNVKHLHLSLAIRHDFLLIFKEAINNLAKYSGATAASISMKYQHPLLTLTISDNGKGFDPETAKRGNGLTNMESRAKKIGATYHISTTIGKGTTITLQVKPT